MDKLIKVNYQKEFGEDGTVYTQTITTTKEIIRKFNAYVEELQEQAREHFVLSNDDMKTLYYLDLLLKDKNFVNLTTLNHFKTFYIKEIYKPAKRDKDFERILWRNTIIKVK